MLDIERRCCTAVGCLAMLTLGSCSEGSDTGDSGLHDLPRTSWRGDFIEFGTDVDSSICPQTLTSLDEYMGGVDEHIRSGASLPIRYFHLSKDLTDYGFGCPPGSHGCIGHDDGSVVVGSKQLSLEHELVHASSATNGHRVLEEGLATFLGTDLDWWGIAEPLDIRGAFESIEGTTSFLPAELYPVAGHFVSYLVEEHGLPAVVALVEASESGMTLDELDERSIEHVGRDLRSAIDDYEASGPGCEVAQYSPTWFQCELTPPSIPIFSCTASDQPVLVDVELACANGASGVQDGMIWRDVLIDVPSGVATLVRLYEGHPVELVVRSCGHGCSTPFTRLVSQTADQHTIDQPFELREGLNLVRILKPVETEGRVRFSVNLLCP
jgi:hypothetical protein